jgi:hypothetical protein
MGEMAGIFKCDDILVRLLHSFQIYCIWMNLIFMGLVPFLLLIVLNSLMLHTLASQNSSTNAANLTLCNQKEIAMAKVSLTIVIIFIVCHSVKWIPNLYELARKAIQISRDFFFFFFSLTPSILSFETINKLKLFFECGNSKPQDADTPLLALLQKM